MKEFREFITEESPFRYSLKNALNIAYQKILMDKKSIYGSGQTHWWVANVRGGDKDWYLWDKGQPQKVKFCYVVYASGHVYDTLGEPFIRNNWEPRPDLDQMIDKNRTPTWGLMSGDKDW